jgi:hypothetical protein
MLLALPSGCSKPRNPLPKGQRTAIEQEIGIPLPPDVILLSVYDGKGRDAPDGFWYWVFYSRTGFDDSLKPAQAQVSSVMEYPKSPPWGNNGPNLELIRGIFQKYVDEDVAEPMKGSSVEWVKGAYVFDGVYLKTVRGAYLKIERFANSRDLQVSDELH